MMKKKASTTSMKPIMTKSPMYWFKKRQLAGMPIASELIIDMMGNGEPEKVMNIVAMCVYKKIASANTIITSIQWLRENSFIKLKGHDDGRTKYCVITGKARRYLEIEDEHRGNHE